MQLIVARLKKKGCEESSSDEDSANKSDEEVIEGLVEGGIQELVRAVMFKSR